MQLELITEPQKRVCWKCKKEYDLTKDNFYKDSKDRHGFQKRCKPCNQVFSRSYNENNKPYFERKNRENYSNRKESDPEYNKNRYNYSKEDFKRRHSERYATVEGRLYDLMKTAEDRALKGNYPFDLDMPFLLGLYNAQDGKCMLTDIPFQLTRQEEDLIDCQYYPYSPSIGKIQPGLGYLKSNVRLVLTAMNLALNQWGEEVFEEVAQRYIIKKIQGRLNAGENS